jgi:type IV pilus assembly protein PilC
MAEFSWEARGRTGELRAGTMVAENADAVNTRLRKQNLNPVKVKKKAFAINLNFQVGTGVDTKDLVTFTRLFATMIDAGLPLVQCLDILASQQPKPAFAAVLRDIKNSVEGGSTFSDALRKHPRIFDELFVNLIQAGEAGGILDNILGRLSIYLEKRQKLVRQVKGALSYPTIVFFIAIGVMAVMLTFVIPAFENMFAEFGGGKDNLPALTRFMVALSHGFITFLPLTVVIVIGIAVGFTYTLKTRRAAACSTARC